MRTKSIGWVVFTVSLLSVVAARGKGFFFAPPPCPNPPVIDHIEVVPTSCGSTTGSITVWMAGNAGDYQFQWSPDLGNTNTLTDLVAGMYRVTITDVNAPDCALDTFVVVPNTDGPQTQIINTAPATCDAKDGQAQLGPDPLLFLWDDLVSGAYRADLTHRTYAVTATDPATNCYSVMAVTIGEHNPLQSTIALVEPATCNQSNGSAVIDVQGGTGDYSYSWGTTGQNSSLPPGDYGIQIVDNGTGCRDSVFITIPNATSSGDLSLVSVTPASCNGGSDGAVEFDLQQGFPFGEPASVLIKTLDGQVKQNGFLSAGPYMAYLLDAGLCLVDSLPFQMTENSSLLVVPNVIPQSCTVGGIISLDVSGGVPPYTFDWADLPGTDDPKDRTDLVSGQYGVTVYDQLGCQYVLPAIHVGDDCGSGTCTNPVIVTEVVVNQATCGQFNGSAKVFINGDPADYEWVWEPATGVLIDPGNERHSLGLGTYSVTITDKLNNACFTTKSFAVTNANGPQAQVVSTTPVTCNGLNGSAELAPASLQYTWADGSHATSRNDLTDGYHFVTVADGNCENIVTVLIEDTKTLDATAVINQKPSCGQSNGSVTIEIANGSGSYSYDWGAGATHTGLAAGHYDVSISDLQTGCDTVLSFALNNDVPEATVTINGPVFTTCAGANDGMVDFDVSYAPGFVGPATIEIRDHADSLVTNGSLYVGPHCIIVKDANGCIAGQGCFYVKSPLALDVYSSVQPVTCDQAGSIDLIVSGGEGGYSYDWADLSGSNNPEDRMSVAAGAYSVTITDGHGCQAVQAINVPDICGCDVYAGTLTADSTDICDQKPNMVISATPGGDAVVPAGYEVRYLLAKASTGVIKQVNTVPEFVIAGSGEFVIHSFIYDPTTFVLDSIHTGQTTVFDVNLQLIQGGGLICAGLDMVGATVLINKCTTCNLPQPEVLVTDAHCGQTDGQIQLLFSQDTTGFRFDWSPDVGHSALVSDIEAGAYYVTVSEYGDEACAVSKTIVVTNADGPVVTIDSIAPTICSAVNGFLRLSPTDLDYLWENGSTSYVRSSLTDTVYAIKATDSASGCFSMLAVEIERADPMDASLEIINHPICGQPNGHAKVSVTGGSGHYAYTWGNFEEKENLLPGDYTLVVVDQEYGCSDVLQFEMENQARDLIAQDSLFLETGQCDLGLPVCFDLPASNAFGYVFVDNGASYTGSAVACGADTMYYYDLSVVGPGLHTVIGTFNGQARNTTFSTFDVLLDSLQAWDPFSGWQLDSNKLVISHPVGDYGDILIVDGSTGLSTILTLQVMPVEQGIQLVFPVGSHDIYVTEQNTGCVDTLYAEIACTPCPEYYTGPDTVFGGICGQDTAFICLNIPPEALPNFTIRDNWALYNGSYDYCANGGTEISLSPGGHTLIVTDNATGCADTVQFFVYCVPPPDAVIDTVLYEHDEIIVCPDQSMLSGNPIFVQELCQSFGQSLVSHDFSFPDFCAHIEGLKYGKDTLCVNLCDDTGDCEVTYVVVQVLPRPDTIHGFVTKTTTKELCVDTSLFVGQVVSSTNLCSGLSGSVLDVQATGSPACVQVTGTDVGEETVCLAVCDSYGYCDTTVFIIESDVPRPDTLDVELVIGHDTLICLDVSELPGDVDFLSTICPDKQGIAFFDLSTTTQCMKITALDYGQDTLCLAFCDPVFCDTAVVAVTVVEDTTQAPLAVDDNYRVVYNTPATIFPLENDILNGTLTEFVIVQPPLKGTAVVNLDQLSIHYQPDRGVCQVRDSLVYRIANKNGTDNAVIYFDLDCMEIDVFSALSPNGDGVNDYLYIQDIDKYPNNEVHVFNRWGNEVFSRRGYSNDDAWDGFWAGNPLPVGTYYYVIMLHNGNGKIYRGYIQISR